MKRFFEKHRNAAICVGLVALTLVVYWQVGSHDFVNYDDVKYVTGNRHVQTGLRAENIVWALTSTHTGNWHPITWLSHMLDCQLHGMNPSRHHMTSVVLHVVNTLLLFLVFRRMTGHVWQNAFVAALFALHPLHVESVAWVSERKDVLSTSFWMLTMWSYIWYVERPALRRYLLVVLFFVLGLMSKPMLVTLPFALLLLDYWPLGRLQTIDGENLPGNLLHLSPIWEKVPLLILSGASSIVTFLAQQSGGAVTSLHHYPLQHRIANALVAYASYLGKTVWPFDLAVFYPHMEGIPAWKVATASFVLTAISIVAIRTLRRHPYITVGWLWYIGTLVPVIGLVQVGAQAMADRYTYVPLIGVFIMFTWGGSELASRFNLSRITSGAVAATILGALMLTARVQVRHWSNTVTLFQHALAVTDDNYVAHNNLGSALVGEGKFGQAMEHLREALRIVPDYADAHNNMGNALAEQELLDDAIGHYTRAVQINPDYAEAHNNLGVALLKQGKLDDASSHFRQALRIQPDYAYAHQNLGSVYAKQGKLEDAISHYHKALRIMPDSASLHNSLANALVDSGRTEEAIRHYTRAVQIKPDYAEAHNNLGYALVQKGDFQSAINHYTEALRIKPEYSLARSNLSSLHVQLGAGMAHQGEFEHAIKHYNEALRLNADSVDAHNNLGNLLLEFAQFDRAMQHFREALRVQPTNATVHYNLGNALKSKGDLKAAAAQYQEALAIDPEYADAINNLALIYMAEGNYESALTLYMRLIELLPQSHVPYYNVACLYSRKNEAEESFSWLGKAIERGFADRDLLATDDDLQNLRESSFYHQLAFPEEDEAPAIESESR